MKGPAWTMCHSPSGACRPARSMPFSCPHSFLCSSEPLSLIHHKLWFSFAVPGTSQFLSPSFLWFLVFLERVLLCVNKREKAYVSPACPTIANTHQSRKCYCSACTSQHVIAQHALTSGILKEYTLLLCKDGLKLEIQKHICKKNNNQDLQTAYCPHPFVCLCGMCVNGQQKQITNKTLVCFQVLQETVLCEADIKL